MAISHCRKQGNAHYYNRRIKIKSDKRSVQMPILMIGNRLEQCTTIRKTLFNGRTWSNVSETLKNLPWCKIMEKCVMNERNRLICSFFTGQICTFVLRMKVFWKGYSEQRGLGFIFLRFCPIFVPSKFCRMAQDFTSYWFIMISKNDKGQNFANHQ